MGTIGLRIISTLFAAIVALAAAGGWYLYSTLRDVETELPVETLAQHRELSGLIQSLSRLSNTLEAAKAKPTAGNLDEFTLALDIVRATPREFQRTAPGDTRDRLQALSTEIGEILSALDDLLADAPPFDTNRAELIKVRLAYALSLLRSNYLHANKQALLILSRQVRQIERLRFGTVAVLALVMLSLGAMGVLLLWQRRAIAALNATRAAVTESEERYRAVVENLLTGVMIHDTEQYLYANETYEKIHGYSKEELLGRDPYLEVPPEQRDALRERGLRYLKSRKEESNGG